MENSHNFLNTSLRPSMKTYARSEQKLDSNATANSNSNLSVMEQLNQSSNSFRRQREAKDPKEATQIINAIFCFSGLMFSIFLYFLFWYAREDQLERYYRFIFSSFFLTIFLPFPLFLITQILLVDKYHKANVSRINNFFVALNFNSLKNRFF